MLSSAVLSILGMSAQLTTQSSVIEGSEETLKPLIESGNLVFVEFYAPWCTHCKQMAPELDKAAERLKDTAAIVKIDATQNEDFAKGHGVEGFPTLMIFHEGQVLPYKGGRTSVDIVGTIKKILSPFHTVLKTAKELKAYKKGKNVKLLLYTHSEDSSALKVFLAYAKANRDAFTYAIVNDTSLFEKREKDFIEMFKPFDNKFSSLDDVTEESLTEWLRMEAFRLFDEIGPANYDAYVKRGLPMVWLFVDAMQKESKEAKEVAKRLAPEYKGKLSFVFVNGNKFAALAEQFGLHDKNYPVALISNRKQDTFRPPNSSEMTVETLRAFCTDYIDGKLTKTMRSMPRPENDRQGSLTIVVGDSFAELVESNETDILISFTAPWRKHCKSMKEAYLQVAEDFKDDVTVRIATLDVSMNDIESPQFSVEGLPAVYFKPKGKDAVLYEGDRSKDDFVAFVNKHKSSAA